MDHVKSVVDRVPGVESGYVPKEVTNHVPRLYVRWDEKAFRFSREDCFKALQEGDPSVVALRTPLGVTVVTWMMPPGEEKIVAERLKEVLEQARRTAHARPPGLNRNWRPSFGIDNPIDEWDPDGDGLMRQYKGPAENGRTHFVPVDSAENGGNRSARRELNQNTRSLTCEQLQFCNLGRVSLVLA